MKNKHGNPHVQFALASIHRTLAQIEDGRYMAISLSGKVVQQNHGIVKIRANGETHPELRLQAHCEVTEQGKINGCSGVIVLTSKQDRQVLRMWFEHDLGKTSAWSTYKPMEEA